MKNKKDTSVVKERSLFQEVVRRFVKNKGAVVALIFIAILAVLALFTIGLDFATDQKFYSELVTSQNLRRRFEAPNFQEIGSIFGRDEFGRSIFFRIIWGTRYSLFLGIFAVSVAALFGGTFGAISGFYGGKLDNVIMRFMDVLLAIPSTLLAIAIVGALGPSMRNVIIAIATANIPQYARIVRASVMTVKDQEFVEAVRAQGANDFTIITKHILPNAMAPVIVQATLGVAGAILSIAGLSFIGLGIQPPTPEWGSMLSNARTYMRDAWQITVIPGAMIMLTILALNLVGDALRDSLDPKLKD